MLWLFYPAVDPVLPAHEPVVDEHATQRRFVYAHKWRQWDLVMWDNRVTMHRARPFNNAEVRDMHRTTVACEMSTMDQAA